jgi:hypothetical protein
VVKYLKRTPVDNAATLYAQGPKLGIC